jgi:hypothetical protein
MDPQATFEAWLQAVEDGDQVAARRLARVYNEWRTTQKGFGAECMVWSERVFGVPVHAIVLKLNHKRFDAQLIYHGNVWTAKLHAARVVKP